MKYEIIGASITDIIIKGDNFLEHHFCKKTLSDYFKLTDDYDFVNPSHYKTGSKEVWEMMVELWGKEKYIAHCEMCAFKYRMRLGKKPGQSVERDLDKAEWYENKANELRD